MAAKLIAVADEIILRDRNGNAVRVQYVNHRSVRQKRRSKSILGQIRFVVTQGLRAGRCKLTFFKREKPSSFTLSASEAKGLATILQLQ